MSIRQIIEKKFNKHTWFEKTWTNKDGEFITITNYPDVVAGWLSADTVAKCITIIQSATTKEEIETKIRALNL